jgi:hypothetical protein
MTGVIWIVQTVHYPLFALLGRDGFGEYAREHQRRITPGSQSRCPSRR